MGGNLQVPNESDVPHAEAQRRRGAKNDGLLCVLFPWPLDLYQPYLGCGAAAWRATAPLELAAENSMFVHGATRWS